MVRTETMERDQVDQVDWMVLRVNSREIVVLPGIERLPGCGASDSVVLLRHWNIRLNNLIYELKNFMDILLVLV